MFYNQLEVECQIFNFNPELNLSLLHTKYDISSSYLMKIEASTLIHTYVVSKYMYMIALASKEQAGLKPNKPGGMLLYQVGTSLGTVWPQPI